jgi:hypothetical protein
MLIEDVYRFAKNKYFVPLVILSRMENEKQFLLECFKISFLDIIIFKWLNRRIFPLFHITINVMGSNTSHGEV